MCPIMRPDLILSFLFFFLLFLWLLAVPLYLIVRLEKIAKILEKKESQDQK